MTEKHESSLAPYFVGACFGALFFICVSLDRIADALERAYPAQEQTP